MDSIKITALPSNGSLKLNGTAVSVNTEILASDIPRLTFVPNSNLFGKTTLSWMASTVIEPLRRSHNSNLNTQIFNNIFTRTTICSTNQADLNLIFPSFPIMPERITHYSSGDILLSPASKNGQKYLPLSFVVIDFSSKYSAPAGTLWSINTSTFTLTFTHTNRAPSINRDVNLVIDVTSNTQNPQYSFKFNELKTGSNYTDADGDNLAKIKILSLPQNGELKVNGVTIGVNSEVWQRISTN